MFFTTILSAFFLATTASNASPIAAQSLIVFSPHITSPKADMVWSMGASHNVTWGKHLLLAQRPDSYLFFAFSDTSNIPYEKRESTGVILLGHAGNNSENLDISTSLYRVYWLGIASSQRK